MSRNTDAPWRDEKLLRQKYIVEEKSTTEIADELDCGSSTIGEWLDKHSIEKRDRGGNSKEVAWKQEHVLRKLYVEKECTMEEIAEKLGCSYSTVNTWIDKFDIETNDVGGNPADAKYKDETWLKEQYIEKRKSAEQIAETCNCHQSSVYYHLRKHDIPREQIHNDIREFETVPYSTIYHREDGQNHYMFIHRLVAYAHRIIDGDELLDAKLDIHHKDGNHWNNSPENLEAVSPEEHQQYH